VGGRVRARRAPDRRLVDGDDLVELVETVDRAVRARALPRSVQAVGDGLVEHFVDERRLARARYAGDAREHPERHVHVDLAQVVFARAEDLDVAARRAPPRGNVDRARAREELSGQRALYAL